MNRAPVKLGPLALLLTVISICLTTMAILTFATARADRRLAEKYADTVQLRYALDELGQEWLQDAARQGDGVYDAAFRVEDAQLIAKIQVEGGQIRVLTWRHERDWEEDLELDLWPGA